MSIHRFGYAATLLGLSSLAAAQGDECFDATPLPFDTAVPFDTQSATRSPLDFSCSAAGGSARSRDVWFEFTPNANYVATVSTCGTADYDTKIEVYRGSCGAPVTVGCNDDTVGCDGFTSSVDVPVLAGTRYLVRVGGYRSGDQGSGTLFLTGPPAQPDDCADAVELLPNVPFAFDTSSANPSIVPFVCGSPASKDVWFSFVAPANYTATASTCGAAGFDTVIEVYSGSCGALVSESCNDDSAGCAGFTSEAEWSAVSGERYTIRVGGFDAQAEGRGEVFVSGPGGSIANDSCIGALPLSSGVQASYDTTLATSSAGIGQMSCGSGEALDLWYTIAPGQDGQVEVETCGSSFDTRLEVYSGGCGSLVSEACNDDSCSLQSRVSFPGVAGQTYSIRVSGYDGATGQGQIIATFPEGVANDDCAAATVLQGQGATVFSNVAATDSGVGMSCGSEAEENDVWFSYVSNDGGLVSVDLSGSDFDTVLTIWSGACGALTEVACDDDGGVDLASALSFMAAPGAAYLIQIGGFDGDEGTGVLAITEGLGALLCAGEVNSTGGAAELKLTGSADLADQDLTLNLRGAPPVQTVLYLNSREMGMIANPAGSQGNLCIAGPSLSRMLGAITSADASGASTLPIDLASIETNNGPVAALSGETWFWQAWYRDIANGAATSNFSSAVGVTFE